MTESFHERLAQLDNSFLIYEDTIPNGAMHVASTQIHEAGPLRRDDGALDIQRIEEYVLSRLDAIPRYRQRIVRTPVEGHPVWVDDARFNIHYHVRHTRLPRPGSERQLKRLVGRIFSQRLDRDKPLWELWVIEGLEGDRVAITSKVHHCMVDGVSGSELISALLSSEPIEKPPPPAPFRPRPLPTRAELLAAEAGRVARAPLLAGEALMQLARDDHGARHELAERLRAVGRLAGDVGRNTPVPFNRPIGPHRRMDWLPLPLDRMREVRRRLGGTLNDVVLATTSGAIARYLTHARGLDVSSLRFRVMTPVSVRSESERGALGNRVSAWVVELPLAEHDPRKCLERIRETTAELKASRSALGAESITRLTEWTGSALLSLGARMISQGTGFNMVVTNVPGPRVPLYLLESRLLEIHPHVPLTGDLGVGLALFSYDGQLSFGYSADWDLVPDLHELLLSTSHAFERLCEAAGV